MIAFAIVGWLALALAALIKAYDLLQDLPGGCPQGPLQPDDRSFPPGTIVFLETKQADTFHPDWQDVLNLRWDPNSRHIYTSARWRS